MITRLKFVVELVITGPEVANYVERVGTGPTTYRGKSDEVAPLSPAFPDFLDSAVGPFAAKDLDPKTEALCELFIGEEWLESVTVKCEALP